MAVFTEKRKYPRMDYQSRKLMFKKDSNDAYSYAFMTNYSQGGMSFKSNEFLDVGQYVVIRMKDHDPLKKGPEKYDYYYGRIRWKDDFHKKTKDASYGYGIKYDQPVI